MPYVVVAAQWLLISVFAAAVVTKLPPAAAYGELVGATRQLLPTRLAGWAAPLTAVVLPLEAGTVGLLLLPATRPAGFALALLLTAGFAMAIAGALRRGVRTGCRCFGATTQPLSRLDLVRNILLNCAAGTGLIGGLVAPTSTDLAGVIIAAATGAVLAVLVIRLPDLAALAAPTSLRRSPPSPR